MTKAFYSLFATLALAAIPSAMMAQSTSRAPSVSASSWPRVTFLAELGPHQFTALRSGTFGGRSLRYRAALSEMIVKDRTGKPASSMYVTSFTALGDPPARRPIVFLYNGGPGAAANTLMFGAFGPQRLARFDSAAQADTSTPLVANGDSILDVADLAFIDAPETGFGRPLPGTDPTTFRSNDGDAFAFAQVILRWLRDHGRSSSPVYIAGESYGSLRSVMLVRDLLAADPQLDLAGVILISQAITYNGPASAGVRNLPDPVRAITRLPDIAALAWYHGLIDNRGQSLQQAVEAARAFALHDYAAALLAGHRLPQAARQHVADDLARLTGVPATTWLTGDLRLPDPRRQLLAARGRAIAQFDGRETEPLAATPPDRDRDWTAAFRGLSAASERFAAQTFGARDLGPFRTLVPDPYGFEDSWTYLKPPAPGLDIVLQEQMRAHPRLRLMVAQGLLDTTASMGATDYLFDQIGTSPDRTVMARYGGGHMFYSDDDGRHAFAQDMRAFVTGRPVPSPAYPVITPGTIR